MLADYRVSQTLVESKTPTGPMRAPVSNTFAFAEQSFLHELALANDRDHVEFLVESMGERRWTQPGNARSINSGRAIDTIRQVADNAGWGRKLPKGRALGLSFYFSHAGHVAEIAEVSVDADKKVDIHKVWVVADIGLVVNASGAENQCQGSVIDAIGTLAAQSIRVKDGAVQESNLHQHPLARIDHRPQIDVQFMQTDYPPTGMGEPAMPPLAAAVCNAIFSVTGERIRNLPISRQGFSI
jgi:isoquinoline 1-oxidoreductase beta subunit